MHKKLSAAPTAPAGITLSKLARDIMPDKKTPEQWFGWPPDVFALCSLVLQRTGGYRLSQLYTRYWEQNNWAKQVREAARLWRTYATEVLLNNTTIDWETHIADNALLKEQYQIIKTGWDVVEVDRLRIISDLYLRRREEEKELIEFATAVLQLLAVADAVSVGIGCIGHLNFQRDERRLFKSVADILLNNTGSLSSIPKFYGTVLPKMRTPQSGMVLRGLSHHLTFHTTEVEITWRTMPWLSNDKKSLNILAVPFPYTLSDSFFIEQEEDYHNVRYFKGDFSKTHKSFLINLAETIAESFARGTTIDILVLPETALSDEEFSMLLELLSDSLKKKMKSSGHRANSFSFPLVIAGVYSDSSESVQPGERHTEFYHNESRVATFFAGKWYSLSQRKHHRWNLDKSQIVQYNLEHKLSTGRIWYENSSIFQRRLSILVPNGWLALTSLICEDLARQEPVSEVIRGIGPTLLFALLSDGPQLSNRWSSRYASVLADDPGTSVLSLSSLGMVQRSRRQQNDASADRKPPEATVALWKDMIRGWQELHVGAETQCGLLFTISSEYKEEFTIDGRSDNCMASVFRMDTITPEKIEIANSGAPVTRKTGNSTNDYWNDIRDLSASLFAIDGILDLMQNEYLLLNKPEEKKAEKVTAEEKEEKLRKIRQSISLLKDLLFENPSATDNNVSPTLAIIKTQISNAWISPHKLGIESIQPNEKKHHDMDMHSCIEEIDMLLAHFHNKKRLNYYDFFQEICNYCESRHLEAMKKRKKNKDERVSRITLSLILYCISNKLAYCDHFRFSNLEKGISPQEAKSLLKEIRELLLKLTFDAEKQTKPV